MTKRSRDKYLRMLTVCNMLLKYFGDKVHPQKSMETNFPGKI